MTALIVIASTLLALLGTPLFVLIGFGALAGFHFVAEIPIAALVQEMARLAQAPALSALPLFTLAGFLMAESKTPERLVD
ncbi:MAG: TRAP transporter large permease, partial [Candidatus Dadabacteria bacterium]